MASDVHRRIKVAPCRKKEFQGVRSELSIGRTIGTNRELRNGKRSSEGVTPEGEDP